MKDFTNRKGMHTKISKGLHTYLNLGSGKGKIIFTYATRPNSSRGNAAGLLPSLSTSIFRYAATFVSISVWEYLQNNMLIHQFGIKCRTNFTHFSMQQMYAFMRGAEVSCEGVTPAFVTSTQM
jgi:hypothetical protein